jgi:hypothetical protein
VLHSKDILVVCFDVVSARGPGWNTAKYIHPEYGFLQHRVRRKAMECRTDRFKTMFA